MLVHNYKPEKHTESDIKMKIILQVDIPVYQRPRRLANIEKQKVNNISNGCKKVSYVSAVQIIQVLWF